MIRRDALAVPYGRPDRNSVKCREFAHMSRAHRTRREFLFASLSGLASTLSFASQEDRPLLDLHQHSLYTGRTHASIRMDTCA
jgi:hypothetical protein